MFWLRTILIWLAGTLGVQAQLLPALAALPVQWQQAETWQWQGQQIQSQRFTSRRSATEILQLVPQLIHQELTALSLSASRVLSFFEQGQHFLLVLSEQKQGVSGWLSSLDLRELNGPQVAPVFDGLYEQIWSMQSQQQLPVYLVLRPALSAEHFWEALKIRLVNQGWQGNQMPCRASVPCEWSKTAQRLVFWQDTQQGFWHVLWWQS